jgi:prepilin-type N-terminal cleavage/methylation domain-containing protein
MIYDFGFMIRERTFHGLTAIPAIRNQKSEIRNGRLLRPAFTLLEIVLALAILAGSLAAIGEIVRLANRNAELASDEAQAQILASSVMSELVSEARDLAAVDRMPFSDVDASPAWLYSVRIDPLTIEQLVMVSVQVIQDLPPEKDPARWELVRWFPDPDYLSSLQESSSEQSSGGSALDGASQ